LRRPGKRCLNAVLKIQKRGEYLSDIWKKSFERTFPQRHSNICEVWVIVISSRRYGVAFRAERKMQTFRVVAHYATLQIISPIIGHYLSIAIGISAKLQFRYGGASRSKVLVFMLHNDIRISPFILLSHKRLYTPYHLFK